MLSRFRRHTAVLALLLSTVAAYLNVACGSSSINVTAPTDVKCKVTATNAGSSAPPDGMSGAITISTNRDCTWSASTTTQWISLTSAVTGQGEGTLTYRVAANPDPSPRHGTVKVNDATVDLAQDAAVCRFSVDMPNTVAAGGGSVAVAVTASSTGCTWTATSSANWITIANAPNGSGNATVMLNVAVNTGSAREAGVTIAGHAITIRQAAAPVGTPPPAPPPEPPTPVPCTWTLRPGAQSVPTAGGSGTVSVDTGSQCVWTASPSATWIAVTSGASGTGSGTVAFTVGANTGGSRMATLTIGNSVATITQAAAACAFSISSAGENVGAAGGTVSVNVTVTAGAGCSWAATGNTPWISITSGDSGTGNGTVTVSINPNTGAARSATMTIAGRPFTISQAAAPCSYSLSPTSQTIATAATTGSFTVSAGSGCSWSAASNNTDWLTITGPSSGTGNGSVSFAATANPGAQRVGTITVNGQIFTVTQAAVPPCTFTLAPTSQSVTPSATTGSFAVTAGANCSWTATSNNADWLTVTSAPNGTGNGSVTFSVAANPNLQQRVGTIAVDGQTFTVTQAAQQPCTFSFNPATLTVPASGGPGTFTVQTTANCGWTAASSNGDWLTLTSAPTGVGTGTVGFNAAPNTGTQQRVGTITVNGQPFTVTQLGQVPCTYSIAPAGQNVGPEGGGGSFAVTTPATCQWSASSSNPDWLAITSAPTGTGNGSITFNAAPNSGGQRVGTIVVNGQTFTVTQLAAAPPAPPPCTLSVSTNAPPPVASGGGTVEVIVSSPAGCTWAASTGDFWLGIVSGSPGNGTGSVLINAQPNLQDGRTGSVVIATQPASASQTVTITQLSGRDH